MKGVNLSQSGLSVIVRNPAMPALIPLGVRLLLLVEVLPEEATGATLAAAVFVWAAAVAEESTVAAFVAS